MKLLKKIKKNFGKERLTRHQKLLITEYNQGRILRIDEDIDNRKLMNKLNSGEKDGTN